MVEIGKAVVAFIGGFVSAIGLAIVLAFSYDPLVDHGFFLGLVGFTYLLYKRKSNKEIIGRTLTILGLESYALPIALIIFTVVFVKEKTAGVAEAAGGLIGGGIAVSIAAIFALFIGSGLIIAGHYISK